MAWSVVWKLEEQDWVPRLAVVKRRMRLLVVLEVPIESSCCLLNIIPALSLCVKKWLPSWSQWVALILLRRHRSSVW